MGILGIDNPADLVLGAFRRDFPTVSRPEAARKEVLELEYSPRRLDILVRGYSADGGLVHIDLAGHLLQRERPEKRSAFLEEFPLLAGNAFHDLDHGAASLLNSLNEPLGRLEARIDEFPRLAISVTGVFQQFVVVRLAHPQPGDVFVVQINDVFAIHVFDDEVRDDVFGIIRRDLETRLRIEGRNQLALTLNLLDFLLT